MSCQSLATRAFLDNDKDMTHCTTFHRSVRFSSESRASGRATDHADKKETSGSVSLTALVTPVSQCSAMSQSAPSNTVNFDLDQTSNQSQSCRFPKLEECAHFHYERVSLGGLSIEVVPCEDSCDDSCDEGWICIKVRSHVNSSPEEAEVRALNASWSEGSDVAEWTLTRSRDNLLRLDEILHKCIYDRKVSGLPNLSTELVSNMDAEEYQRLISDYMHHLSIIADDSINCGPALNWLQMDNKGHKLLVANEDSSSINTPAVAAAYSVRKYVSQARDEISFDVGDMISIIDMPGPQESLWWRGKRGFRVGFFPHHCVAVIGDKVPRHMTQPPPIVGSVAMTPIKPVLRKHGKLISLFRSFILSRPSRRSLKQQGILRERVFGCDLGEHLLNCGHHVPLVLVECSRAIESRGAVDGVYRLSGGSGLTQRLRSGFDSGAVPDLSPNNAELARDPHAVPSLLKMYFRELPNPLCTYQLYESFVAAVQMPEEAARLRAVRHAAVKLPPPHYRTLAYLMRHLRRVSLLGGSTGMTPRNMAIVWAPNLLRAPRHHHALQGVAVQAVVTEFLICYAEELFALEQGADSDAESIGQDICEPQVELRGSESGRRPKSLPVNPPTKLLSLEEARRRGGCSMAEPPPPAAPVSAPLVPPVSLRPAAHLKPKYIEVGSGPNNLPQYHTVLDLPLSGSKRGVKRSPVGWRGLFSRSKQQRGRAPPPRAAPPAPPPELQDVPMAPALRPVKSYESLGSETDTLAPLAERAPKPLAHHTRSSSCDSYFEPWQAELAEMRLRLSPQERDHHMFSEEDDTQILHQGGSWGSTPAASVACSAEPSPRRATQPPPPPPPEAHKRTSTLDELAHIGFIDGEPPRAPEKRHSARDTDAAKRLCKDRDSSKSTKSDSQTTLVNVKLRDRGSPRKPKTRHSGFHHENDENLPNRLSWHGKDIHSTKIRIDWPSEPSVLESSPQTPSYDPQTPSYDPLETDSELSEKHTIKISDCFDCAGNTCLKCELKAADSLHSSEISYQNLNRLSAISTSSSEKKRAMTSSHESSSLSNDFDFPRPNYINLQSCSTSPGSPLKSPLKSTISITFRSPNKSERDSVYEDIDLDKNLSIVEEAIVPHLHDASLPTQQACQPDYNKDLIILETPTNEEVYSQVKFFKKSIEEVNAMMLESPETKEVLETVFMPEDSVVESVLEDSVFLDKDDKNHYENVQFDGNEYENINVDTLKICDKLEIKESHFEKSQELNLGEAENGNVKTEAKNLNVRELANRFESPTEQKGPFTFEKFKAEVKYPSLERQEKVPVKSEQKTEPESYKLNKTSARSLDENAFVKEFGEKDRRKSLEVNRKATKFQPDFNLNPVQNEKTTPTTENRISLIQFNEKRPDIKTIISFETEKKLSRERIEKYKEERRNFLREKYSSQSFRSNPEQLTRLKIKKEDKMEQSNGKFERRNTVDLGQRMRFSLAKSSGHLDAIQSPTDTEDNDSKSKDGDSKNGVNRNEKLSPSYNIRDMAALFEHQQNPNTG